MISYPKMAKSALLGLIFAGLVSTSANSQATPLSDLVEFYSKMQREVPQSVKTAGLITAFVIPTMNAYIALTQDEQPELHNGTVFEKMLNWYLRVVCGKASKKTQVVQPDGEIKDVYSKSSGIFGQTITFYEANEKDVKKAMGIGAIPVGLIAGWLTLNTIQDLLVSHALKAPWGGEVFGKMPIPTTPKPN